MRHRPVSLQGPPPPPNCELNENTTRAAWMKRNNEMLSAAANNIDPSSPLCSPAMGFSEISFSENVRRAMLEGALQKAKDAVYADQTKDFEYAMRAYGDSCALLGQVMTRTQHGSEEWRSMEAIVGINAISMMSTAVMLTSRGTAELLHQETS